MKLVHIIILNLTFTTIPQTPVGRGLQSFTGSYLWNLDSYTKFALGPTGPLGIDWVKEFENGTYVHQTEPKHSTVAITDKVIQHMKVRITF